MQCNIVYNLCVILSCHAMLSPVTSINPRSDSIPNPKCYSAANNLNSGHEYTEGLLAHRSKYYQQEIEDSHICRGLDCTSFIFIESDQAEESEYLDNQSGFGWRWSTESRQRWVK